MITFNASTIQVDSIQLQQPIELICRIDFQMKTIQYIPVNREKKD